MSTNARRTRVLHVAALPFPSHQGTQAAIRSMLETASDAGRDVHLFTYAAAGHPITPRFALHRAPGSPHAPSLRSGPSLHKVWLDARMFLGLRALEARLSPDVIVAHHVEAAVQALALLRTPVVFFAHTDLGSELPTYGPQLVRSVLGTAGRALDHALLRRSAAVAVISRALHERFTTELPDILDKTAYVPTPWPVAPHAAEGERLRSRQWLGLDQSAHVLLYAGNLDRYQGIHTLLLATRTLALRHPRIALLVATESDARELREQATRLGLAARLHVTHLLGEGVRRRVHAAADVAVVPRLAPGGLPVKLLDALARGVPCAASPHACAGLSLRAAVSVAADESSEALGEAIHILLASSAMRVAFAARGRAHLGMEHAPERHLDALDALIAHATHSQRAHAAQHL